MTFWHLTPFLIVLMRQLLKKALAFHSSHRSGRLTCVREAVSKAD